MRFILFIFLFLFTVQFGQAQSHASDSIEICSGTVYAVQVLSTSICPSINEDAILEIADSYYIESVEVKGQAVNRYMIACKDRLEAGQRLVLAQTKFKDAFIVLYHNGTRFN